jgi:hypothetical protein
MQCPKHGGSAPAFRGAPPSASRKLTRAAATSAQRREVMSCGAELTPSGLRVERCAAGADRCHGRAGAASCCARSRDAVRARHRVCTARAGRILRVCWHAACYAQRVSRRARRVCARGVRACAMAPPHARAHPASRAARACGAAAHRMHARLGRASDVRGDRAWGVQAHARTRASARCARLAPLRDFAAHAGARKLRAIGRAGGFGDEWSMCFRRAGVGVVVQAACSGVNLHPRMRGAAVRRPARCALRRATAASPRTQIGRRHRGRRRVSLARVAATRIC